MPFSAIIGHNVGILCRPKYIIYSFLSFPGNVDFHSTLSEIQVNTLQSLYKYVCTSETCYLKQAKSQTQSKIYYLSFKYFFVKNFFFGGRKTLFPTAVGDRGPHWAFGKYSSGQLIMHIVLTWGVHYWPLAYEDLHFNTIFRISRHELGAVLQVCDSVCYERVCRSPSCKFICSLIKWQIKKQWGE